MEKEKAIWKGAPRLAAFYGFYVTGGLALVMTVAAAVGICLPLYVWGVVLPFCGMMFVLPLFFQRAWQFTVTDRTVRSEFNFGIRRVQEASVSNITDVTVMQGIIGRLLGFGEVRASTAGTFFPGVSFWGVGEPFEVGAKIRKLIVKDQRPPSSKGTGKPC